MTTAETGKTGKNRRLRELRRGARRVTAAPVSRYLVKAAISVLLVWLLVRNRDLGGLAREMLAVEPRALLAAVAGLLALLIPQALRWSAVLRAMGHPIGLRVTLPVTMVGLFFSQVLPSSIGGDGMRIWELHRAGLTASAAISSVLIDRAVGLAAICLLVTATLPILLDLVSSPAVESGVMLLLALGYSGLGAAMLFDRLPEMVQRFRVVRAFAGLSSSLRTVMLTPPSALAVLGASFVYQVGIAAVVFALARGIGMPVQASACLVLVPLANLAALLPISIAGWGVRESAFVVGFGLVGIAAPDALALSVLFGLLNTLVGIAGGLVWLARRRPRPTRAGP